MVKIVSLLMRNGDFSLKTPDRLSKVRAKGMNRSVVRGIFDIDKEITEELGIP
jgi:hypothetical protein